MSFIDSSESQNVARCTTAGRWSAKSYASYSRLTSLRTNLGYKVYRGFLVYGILQEFWFIFWYIGRFIAGILVFHNPFPPRLTLNIFKRSLLSGLKDSKDVDKNAISTR